MKAGCFGLTCTLTSVLECLKQIPECKVVLFRTGVLQRLNDGCTGSAFITTGGTDVPPSKHLVLLKVRFEQFKSTCLRPSQCGVGFGLGRFQLLILPNTFPLQNEGQATIVKIFGASPAMRTDLCVQRP